jgi:hypothetical protein
MSPSLRCAAPLTAGVSGSQAGEYHAGRSAELSEPRSSPLYTARIDLCAGRGGTSVASRGGRTQNSALCAGRAGTTRCKSTRNPCGARGSVVPASTPSSVGRAGWGAADTFCGRSPLIVPSAFFVRVKLVCEYRTNEERYRVVVEDGFTREAYALKGAVVAVPSCIFVGTSRRFRHLVPHSN